jgi:predicted RNA-binding protein YlxR (DUF448 family)
MRLVRTVDGHVAVDPTGKRNGRGTYVHKTRDCFQAVIDAPGKLQHALKLEGPPASEDLSLLADLAKSFPASDAMETGMKGLIGEPRRAPNRAAHQTK